MGITKEYMALLLSEYKKRNALPFIVEVLGTPNSGKTSAIQTFEKVLKRNGIKYKVIYEAAGKCKIKNKLSPDFNIWTLSETIKQLIEADSENYEIVICERGLLDAICWYELYYMDGDITGEEHQRFLDYILLNRFIKKINCCYIMRCGIDVAIKRENLSGLLDISGTIINRQVLTKYNAALQIATTRYGNRFNKILELDTSNLSQTDINKCFISSLLNYIKDLSTTNNQ